MARKLFCEINPLTYKISILKENLKRYFTWIFGDKLYAKTFNHHKLPVLVYKHTSLIRRTLGNVDIELQNNKAINLNIATTKVNNIIIRPNETFSFWKLIGVCTRKKGYLDGLIIKGGAVDKGVGGGMCQFTNLIHWMILHSPLDIVEHHHHNSLDLFPDFNRQIPFGIGTSIMYNYLDYQVTNHTENTFQIRVSTTETHLCGELRCSNELKYSYHIQEESHYYSYEGDRYYRNNEIFRETIDKQTGNLINKQLLIKNHSKVMYDDQYIPKDKIRVKMNG
ncbi:MAG: vancomycin resistance protein [Firmicutes bacterium HGW-Firmicutes-1]|jgi:vancomycin resistance protein VanW|nr:MAG: vancomycin resistance protein [Firmicutes bacterium HGW-Firmicutes-1]